MALSAFGDQSHPPTETDLQVVLGPAYASWTRLLEAVGEHLPALAAVWKYASMTTGWGLRLVNEERVILYMTPQRKQFLASFVLGERAVAAARAAKLPQEIRRLIDAAPRYAEGRGFRIPVSSATQVSAIVRLARIKYEN